MEDGNKVLQQHIGLYRRDFVIGCLLKDFVAIFHPELVEADYQPTFYYLLK